MKLFKKSPVLAKILIIVVLVTAAGISIVYHSDWFKEGDTAKKEGAYSVPFGLMLDIEGKEKLVEDEETESLQMRVFSDLRTGSDLVTGLNEQDNYGKIVYQTRFKKCGHLIRREEVMPLNLKKLSVNELEKMFVGWEVVVATDNEVVLYREVDKVCQDKIHLYLGIEDGRVAVFEGKPGSGGKVSWITLIPVHSIPESEIKRLEEGIMVTSEEELYGLIEGLASSYRD